MNTSTQKTNFTLLLEGVVVPFTNCSINISEAGPVAVIDVAMHPSLSRIAPRTKVHLLEDILSKNNEAVVRRMVFEGEVYGIGASESSGRKTFTLTCSGITSYLDFMYKLFFKGYNPFTIDQKQLALFGASDGDAEILVREAPDTARKTAIMKGKNVVDVMYSLLDEIIKSNEFFKNVDENIKLSRRFTSLPDTVVESIFNQEAMKQIIQKAPMNDMLTLAQTFRSIVDMIFYNMGIIEPPSMVNKELTNVVYKPDSMAIAPPVCNLILPCGYGALSFNRNLMAEPTRLGLKSAPVTLENGPGRASTISQCVAYAPHELKEAEDKNVLHRFLLEEEKIKGIIPLYTQNSLSIQSVGMAYDDSDNVSMNDSLRSLYQSAETKLNEARAAASSLSVSGMPINFNLIVGFNAAVVSKDMIYIGHLNRVSHNIAPTGCSTSISISKCRQARTVIPSSEKSKIVEFDCTKHEMSDDERASARILGDLDTPFPPIVSTAYRNDNINNTYMAIIGCLSVVGRYGDPKSKSITEEIRKIYSEYISYQETGSGTAFYQKITSRPIPSDDDIINYIGFKVSPGSIGFLSGGGIIQDRQNIIIEYINSFHDEYGVQYE